MRSPILLLRPSLKSANHGAADVDGLSRHMEESSAVGDALNCVARRTPKRYSIMPSGFSRRNLLLQMGAAALTPAIVPLAIAQQGEKPWWLGDGMPQESAGTPKIACAIDLHNGVTDEAIRSVVQIGVCHVLSGGPPIPWSAAQLQPTFDKLKSGRTDSRQPDDRRLSQHALRTARAR